MKKILTSAFSLLFLQLVIAQNPHFNSAQIETIDSLKAKLALSKADTNRVKMLMSLTDAYGIRREEAEPYARQAVDLTRRLDNQRLQSASLRSLAIVLQFKEQHSEAITHLLHALRISEDIKDKNEIGENTKQIGVIYFDQKDYAKARQYLMRSKALLEELGNDLHLSITAANLGRLHYETGRQDSALLYFEQSHQLGLKSKNLFIIPRALMGQGGVYAKKGNYAAAMKYYRQSLSYNQPDIFTTAVYLSIAKNFQKTGQRDSALFYGKLSFNSGNYNRASKLSASEFLSELLDGRNDAEAYKYLKIARRLDDSLGLAEKAIEIQNISFREQQNLQTIEAARLETSNRMRLYIVLGGLLSFLVIAIILFRNNLNKKAANELLKKQKQEVEKQRTKAEQALIQLKTTQAQLFQSEKMASLGELTAGIAHEIQNPLNFVNNFSEVTTEMVDEMEEAILKSDREEIISISSSIKENLQKIVHHGKRADAIVKGMLQHSRASTGKKELTDINALADEYLRFAYHGLRAKDKEFNAIIETDFDESIDKIEVAPQDIARVLLNLYNNAFYALNEKKKQLNGIFEPTVLVSTKRVGDKVELSVTDNGTGIPSKVLDKIYQPFFTTKPTGQGTGLGLSLSYDIIKAHSGEIKVETKKGEGTEFIIQLPLKVNG